MFILFEKGTEYSCQNCDARCIVFILARDIDLRLCGLCYEELRRALKVSETEPRSPTNDAAKPLPEGWKPSRMRKKPDGHEYLGAGVEISGLRES